MTELVARLPRVRRRRRKRKPPPPELLYALFMFVAAIFWTVRGVVGLVTGEHHRVVLAFATGVLMISAVIWWQVLGPMLKRWWDDE